MPEDSQRIDMNRSVIRHLAIAALVAYPVSALGADPAPDVKGKWISKTPPNSWARVGKAKRSWDLGQTGPTPKGSTALSCTQLKRTR
jgi:hypothetical protein